MLFAGSDSIRKSRQIENGIEFDERRLSAHLPLFKIISAFSFFFNLSIISNQLSCKLKILCDYHHSSQTKHNRLFHTFISTRCSSLLVKMGESNSSSDPSAYAEIIVVRHGETEWNAEGRIQGHLDVELNEVGRQQAVSVADRLSKEPKISAVYSSDLKRAIVTAETIAARCGGLEVIQDAELRERHLGILQGLKLQEAAKISPEAYQAFLCCRTNQDIPGGGESLDQLYQRSTSFLQRIARKHMGERVVVVTHGGVIRALYRQACPNKKLIGKVLNTSVNIFHIFGEKKWL